MRSESRFMLTVAGGTGISWLITLSFTIFTNLTWCLLVAQLSIGTYANTVAPCYNEVSQCSL